MAWEVRGHQRYWYRPFRDASGQVRREYLSRGQRAAEAAARRDLEAAAAVAQAQQLTKMKDQQARMEALTADWQVGLELLVRAHLLLAGYHPHAGSWRKRRGQSKTA